MKRKHLIIFLVVALIFFVIALIFPVVLSSRNTMKDIEQIFVENSYTFNAERSVNSILAGERYNANLNDNLDLQIFIYDTKENANIDANRISADGFSYSKTDNEEVTVSHIDWIGPPHFYKFRNAILLYIGNNQDLLNLLSAEFGKQIAGAE